MKLNKECLCCPSKIFWYYFHVKRPPAILSIESWAVLRFKPISSWWHTLEIDFRVRIECLRRRLMTEPISKLTCCQEELNMKSLQWSTRRGAGSTFVAPKSRLSFAEHQVKAREFDYRYILGRLTMIKEIDMNWEGEVIEIDGSDAIFSSLKIVWAPTQYLINYVNFRVFSDL